MKKTSTPVSPLEAHLGFWMRYVSNRVSSEFERAMLASGVSVTEWVALRTLYAQGESTHAALMASLGMTKGAISKVITRLQQKALLERTPHGEDARAQVLTLTAAGRALVPRLAKQADQNDERFFGHLSAKQRAQLAALLKEMVRLHHMHEVPVA